MFKEKNMTSFILGQYNEERLIYKGHVTLGVTFRKLADQEFEEIPTSPFGFIPRGNENAIWIKPKLVCIIEYMPTDSNAFRQPVFKGFRDDKLAIECQIKQ
jgi:bifunctional non-homologous end joining protein LigD